MQINFFSITFFIINIFLIILISIFIIKIITTIKTYLKIINQIDKKTDIILKKIKTPQE